MLATLLDHRRSHTIWNANVHGEILRYTLTTLPHLPATEAELFMNEPAHIGLVVLWRALVTSVSQCESFVNLLSAYTAVPALRRNFQPRKEDSYQ
jgi:hypothetical protein